MVVAPFVYVGLVAGAVGVSMRASRQRTVATEALLDRDMENGVLATRFQDEKLQPQLSALEKEKTELLEKGVAIASFTAAVKRQSSKRARSELTQAMRVSGP